LNSQPSCASPMLLPKCWDYRHNHHACLAWLPMAWIGFT
jgi:hypothetical protein